MKRLLFPTGIIIFAGLSLGQNTTPPAAPRALIDRYCVTCHNERAKTAGLMLDKMDLAHIAESAETWEKVIRKLRGGMMPPMGRPRPANDEAYKLISWLEMSLDRAGIAKPNPGRPTIHRP